MTKGSDAQVSDLRERLLSAAELACAAWIVIGHNVLRIFPNEAPILAAIALVSARLMCGGFAELGFRRPGSWRLVIGLAVAAAALRLLLGAVVIEPLTAHIWPPIVGPRMLNDLKGNVGSALSALALVWTFAAFGEEIGYRGLILGRTARALGGGRWAWIASAVVSGVLFGYGHFYKGPAGVLDSGVAGLILAAAYLLSGRCLWTTILAHGLIDTTALVLAFFGLDS